MKLRILCRNAEVKNMFVGRVSHVKTLTRNFQNLEKTPHPKILLFQQSFFPDLVSLSAV